MFASVAVKWETQAVLLVVEIIISSFEAINSGLNMIIFASKTIKSGSEAIWFEHDMVISVLEIIFFRLEMIIADTKRLIPGRPQSTC